MSPSNTPENTPDNGPARKPRKPAKRSQKNPSAAPAAVDPVAAATALLERTYVEVMRHEPQLRCFDRATRDLGLPVPRDWARFADDDTVTFAPISAKKFRLLINALEHIADGLPDLWQPAPQPQANDVQLFEVITTEMAAQETITSNSYTIEEPDEQ